jgi:DNA-binding MarR family transcriptional regulator
MDRLELDKFLPYRLSIASNTVSNVIAQAYQRLFNLTISEWRVMAVLGEDGAQQQQALVTRTRMDKMTVSRAVRPLVERGLIDRASHSDDGRSFVLSLSRDGQALYDHVVPEARRLEAALITTFSPDDVAMLSNAMRRLEAAALAMISEADG